MDMANKDEMPIKTKIQYYTISYAMQTQQTHVTQCTTINKSATGYFDHVMPQQNVAHPVTFPSVNSMHCVNTANTSCVFLLCSAAIMIPFSHIKRSGKILIGSYSSGTLN